MLLFEEEFVQLVEQKLKDVCEELAVRQREIRNRSRAIFELERQQNLAEKVKEVLTETMRTIQSCSRPGPAADPSPPSPRPAS